MEEQIFNLGDYVKILDEIKNTEFIGYVVVKNNHEVEGKGVKYRGGKYSYDILFEKSGKHIIMLKNAVVNADSMRLLAKADTIACKALKLALDAHEGQVDKAGVDYAHHFVTVGEFVKEVTNNDQILAVAYLHDVLEDTEVTEEDLREMFPTDVVEAVKALTKEKYENYQYYLDRVKANEWAKMVKLADLKHNSDIDRIKKKLKTPLDCRDFERMKKYQDAIKFLEAE